MDDANAQPKFRRAFRQSGGWLLALALTGCQAPAEPATGRALPPGASFAISLSEPAASQVIIADRPVPTGPVGPGSPSAPGAPSGGSGGSGGASNGPTPSAGTLSGQVLAEVPGEADAPVAGAKVAVYGRGLELEVTADAQGRYALEGVSSDRLVVATAEGFAPSVVAGWAPGALDLHLAAASHPRMPSSATLKVSGDVFTMEGAPASGAIVVGGNAAGTTFGPLVADENGHFEGPAESHEGVSAKDVAVFAFMQTPFEAVRSLGLSEGVTLGLGAGPMQLRLAESTGSVQLVAEAPAGRRSGRIVARSGNGMAVTLQSWLDGAPLAPCPYFELPGATIETRLDVASADGLARSSWGAAVTGPGVVTARLLPYPDAPSTGQLADGSALAWSATPGATGYRVSLWAHDQGQPLWEAFSPTSAATLFSLPARRPDRLEVMAIAGATARQLASLSSPRHLRLLDPDGAPGAYATRTVTLQP